MKGIYSRVESIYQNYLSPEKVLYNPTEIDKRYVSEITRYKITLCNATYEPYEVDPEVYNNLFKYINTVDIIYGDINNSNEKSKELIENIILEDKKSKLVITEPENINNLMESGVLTPAGLLALRFNRTYNDKNYKEFIEKDFLNNYFYFNEDLDLYIMKEMYLNKFNISIKDVIGYINLMKSLNKVPLTPYSYVVR